MRSEIARIQILVASAIILQACGGTTVDVGPADGGTGVGGSQAGGSVGSARGGSTQTIPWADAGGSANVGAWTNTAGGSSEWWNVGGAGGGSMSTGGWMNTGAWTSTGGWMSPAGGTTASAGGSANTGGGDSSGKGGRTHVAAGGSGNPDASTGAGGLPIWPDPLADAGPSTVPIVGVWNGYTENGIPPWDSSIRIVITSASEAFGVQGTMTVGTGDPPPPVTDPNVGYPPGYMDDSMKPSRDTTVHPGFAYTLLSGTFKDGRVRFTISEAELWREWCALQTSYLVTPESNTYSCLPTNGGGYSSTTGCTYTDAQTQQNVSVNCGKLGLCMGASYCACDASRCTASQNGYTFTCDLRFEAAQASGSCTEGAVTGSSTRLFRAD